MFLWLSLSPMSVLEPEVPSVNLSSAPSNSPFLQRLSPVRSSPFISMNSTKGLMQWRLLHLPYPAPKPVYHQGPIPSLCLERPMLIWYIVSNQPRPRSDGDPSPWESSCAQWYLCYRIPCSIFEKSGCTILGHDDPAANPFAGRI